VIATGDDNLNPHHFMGRSFLNQAVTTASEDFDTASEDGSEQILSTPSRGEASCAAACSKTVAKPLNLLGV